MAKKSGKLQTEPGGTGLKDKLLVIGGDIGFSDLLTDYSLAMAERMEYSILAATLHTDTKAWEIFSDSPAGLVDEDRIKEREKAVRSFAGKAKRRGIEFEWMEKSGELDKVAREICQERENIDLILVEPEYVSQNIEGPRCIPAFTFAPSEE